jgi:DNA-binding MarR family transcriptional regulator
MSDSRGPLRAGAAVIRLTTAVGERVLEVRAASGLTALQLQVLRVAADGASMTGLARALGAPKTTVTSVIDQLEAMGLVVRTKDEADRRRKIVRNTAAGSRGLSEFDRALSDRIDELLTNLRPGRARRLRALMAKLPDATVPLPLVGPR